MAVIPDPVTCYSTAKYSQRQVFRIAPDSNLLLVDWITSGRHERGEKWEFDLYKSTNHIFLDGDQPLFLDTLMLEQQGITSIAERMRDYQVVATLILLGPKLKNVQNQIQQDVKRIMSQNLHIPSSFGSGHYANKPSNHSLAKPSFVASCSPFGPKGVGVVTRVAAVTTESVYNFLRTQLSSLKPLLGVSPYC
nr:urease accessory protein D isoform X1 [Ipomoea batatas]